MSHQSPRPPWPCRPHGPRPMNIPGCQPHRSSCLIGPTPCRPCRCESTHRVDVSRRYIYRYTRLLPGATERVRRRCLERPPNRIVLSFRDVTELPEPEGGARRRCQTPRYGHLVTDTSLRTPRYGHLVTGEMSDASYLA